MQCTNILRKIPKLPRSISCWKVVDENLTVSAEEEFLRKEKIENLRKAIFKLRKKYRDVIVYRTYLQLSFKEISQVMGISESNAKVLYARGKEQIRRFL